MEISEPVSLARLPRSPQGVNDVTFGSVWGWRSGVKRKRHEICAAIESTCLNIYEAQSGRVLFSYAVPPSTVFSGPPCSLRWKEHGSTHRQTCFATSDHGLRLHSVWSRGSETAKPISVELVTSASPVIHLEPSRSDTSVTITVLQADGTVTIVSGDLQSVASSKIALKEGAPIHITAASLLTAANARKFVLKARPDISSIVGNDSQVLLVATQSQQRGMQRRALTYAAWSLDLASRRPSHQLEISPLFEHDLSHLTPALANTDVEITSSSFGVRNMCLDFRISRGLYRIDLHGATPRPLPPVSEVLSGSLDLITVSPSHVLAAYAGRMRILDVNYSTVRLEYNRKRKREGRGPATQFHFISYFSQINRVLARDGSRLLAIDLTPITGHDGKQLATSTLSDNLGRGLAVQSQVNTNVRLVGQAIGTGGPVTQPLSPVWKTKLSTMLDDNNVDGFESIVISHFGSEGESSSNVNLSDELVDFVISSMFNAQTVSEDQGRQIRLQLNISASSLLKALNERGYLRPSSLRRALRLGREQMASHLRPDGVARALQDADPSLNLLLDFSSSNGSPDVSEHCRLLKYLIQQALTDGNVSQPPRLMAAEASEQTAMEVLSDVENLKGKQDPAMLEHCLVAVLDRFGRFSLTSISTSIRSVLSSEEVFGVVQILRQQMFRSGHTGSLLASEPEENLSLHRRVSLESAVKILSACVDAIGPLDLVSDKAEDDFIERIFPDLLSEISLATQYIEESADLQGLLRETLRHAEAQEPTVHSNDANRAKGLQTGRPGQIVTIYEQRTEDDAISDLPGALPLSLRADGAFEAIKVRRGGGQVTQRSERETLMLENRQKGPYTFERLFL
ncbi:uncharacterized protein HMPREF1541_03837 [Cyphellophora europaea CBS 101466]|uniref:Uncharacterized protein n=1 Tax=Cyphellophora europaea (strain CBS 101466) TaxID=1220924 RepID=W2S1J0_CYPE1|nr:uncharacterized protein HMPREF1541_03837 [Cyphellophora europaea CBS 101466]ETN41898.1 hypothetical protein HMPREF1541_03837 [Cyphellophora europaea CBS 101466]